MIEFIDEKSKYYFTFLAIYPVILLGCSFAYLGNFTSNTAWSFMAFYFAAVAYIAYKRSKLEAGPIKKAWIGFALFYASRTIFIALAYPNYDEPTTIEYVIVSAIIALASVSALSWPHIQTLSRPRVLLDSAWISLCLVIAGWFVFLESSWQQLSDPLDRIGTIITLVAVAWILGFLINIAFQTTGRGAIGPILVGGTFTTLAAVALNDIVSFTEFNTSNIVSIIWFLVDIPLVLAALTKSEVMRKDLLSIQKRNHVTWLTVGPLLFAIAVLVATAPRELIGVIMIGATVACILAVRITVIGSENQRLSNELHKLALTDDLTGLPNRRALQVDLNKLAEAKDPLVIYVDLDHFKEVNDRYGHQAGDELLRTFASRVSTHLRESDKCYRVGGDEFVVVVDREIELEDSIIEKLVERLRSSVENDFQLSVGVSATLGMSVGVARGSANGHDLLHAADKAMFQAKADGRSSTSFTNV